MNKVKTALVAAGLSAGLVGGGLAGAVLGSSGVSGAQDTTTTTAPATAPAPDAQRPDPSQRFQETLKPLVDNGTITQAQADAVIKALVDAGPPKGERGPGGHGGPGGRGMRGGPGLDKAAEALGLTADQLRTELQSGKTLAQIAQEKGVDKQKVIDAMVAGLKAHLDEEVKSGEHTQAEADQKLIEGTQRITDMVNNGFKGGPGRGGPDAPPPADGGSTGGN
ncbi:MAG: hypothetical protein ACOYOP_03545 [Microthrixaceae bacterium]